jgi:hypothetical protein
VHQKSRLLFTGAFRCFNLCCTEPPTVSTKPPVCGLQWLPEGKVLSSLFQPMNSATLFYSAILRCSPEFSSEYSSTWLLLCIAWLFLQCCPAWRIRAFWWSRCNTVDLFSSRLVQALIDVLDYMQVFYCLQLSSLVFLEVLITWSSCCLLVQVHPCIHLN